jgi:hypothetical protein
VAAFVARNDGELLAWLLEQAIDRNAAPLVDGIRSSCERSSPRQSGEGKRFGRRLDLHRTS